MKSSSSSWSRSVVIYSTIGNEPFGLVPVQGMACAVPVIATRSGGMVEPVVDGETGFLISSDEDELPAALADRVIHLLIHPVTAHRLGANGRARAEKRFDKARMAADLIDLSHAVLRAPRG